MADDDPASGAANVGELTARRRVIVPVAVHEVMGQCQIARQEREIDANIAAERGELAIVVSKQCAHAGARAELLDERAQNPGESRAGCGGVNDVAEHHELVRPVIVEQRVQSLNGILTRCDRKKLAGVPVRPSVTEVKIGYDQNARIGQPDRAAGVEPKGGSDFEAGLVQS